MESYISSTKLHYLSTLYISEYCSIKFRSCHHQRRNLNLDIRLSDCNLQRHLFQHCLSVRNSISHSTGSIDQFGFFLQMEILSLKLQEMIFGDMQGSHHRNKILIGIIHNSRFTENFLYYTFLLSFCAIMCRKNNNLAETA